MIFRNRHVQCRVLLNVSLLLVIRGSRSFADSCRRPLLTLGGVGHFSSTGVGIDVCILDQDTQLFRRGLNGLFGCARFQRLIDLIPG